MMPSFVVVSQPSRARSAWLLCALGVLSFSFTLPATRVAAGSIDPILLGLGRCAVAGLLAVIILLARKQPLPAVRQWRSIAWVALGVVLAFPLLTSLALQHVPAFHAVIVTGLMPLATSIAAVVRNGERPSRSFWLFALLGATAVLAFGLVSSAARLESADLLLGAAVLLVGIGYAEGGRLAREIDGAYVICWALVLALPITLGAAAYALSAHAHSTPTPLSLLGFFHLSVVSMLLGFFAYYRGLALGGVARGSQVQLVQPLLSLFWCWLLLNESLSPHTVWAAVLVLTSALGSRWARA